MHKITYQTFQKKLTSLYVGSEADLHAMLNLLSGQKTTRAIKVWLACETLVTKNNIDYMGLVGYTKLVEEFTWNFTYKISDDGGFVEIPQ